MHQDDDMFEKFFQQNNFPNPFDPEGFGKFIHEQIKNAMPDNGEAMGQSWKDSPSYGNRNGGQGNTGMSGQLQSQNTAGTPAKRKGTTSGFGRSTNIAKSPNPPNPTNNQQQSLNYQGFETHDEFIFRVQIPDDVKHQPKNMYLNSHEVSLVGRDPKVPLLQTQLPKPVEPEQTKYRFQHGVLEIKLVKKPHEPTSEINLSNLFRPN
ncbi:hypothetical protein EV207_13825 [Scopulibacillus darangshiensis]|uniref:HSP20 family molecular chaperone IbpA n=1 Tax=Scopulibacillus darangshiensis TaxID=442528 RepID=A0A4R2NKS6_9BACL|nr:Hsp20/alpha crystallin family protein [Scopulibacillus darangshiensis]TCP21938.1 hypothetical protein EV207_13825 [Scopulibacillus darangshiensis]